MRIVVVAVLVVAGLAGCSDLHGAELAAAECRSAVHDDLNLPENESTQTSDMQVTKDDDGLRVTGRWSATAGEGEFSCVVVPDASDEPRGLRVTDLSVQRLG
jgi:hypothetical protein